MAPGRLGKLPNQVPLPTPPEALGHGVVRRCRGPKAEAVVMFCSEDQFPHSHRRCHISPLVRIETGGGEQGWGFVTKPPLLIREGVDGEVNEARELHLLVPDLFFRRNRGKRIDVRRFSRAPGQRGPEGQDPNDPVHGPIISDSSGSAEMPVDGSVRGRLEVVGGPPGLARLTSMGWSGAPGHRGWAQAYLPP